MTKVFFFGRARDAAGCTELHCDVPATIETAGELRAWFAQRDPELGMVLAARDIRIAADRVVCPNDNTSIRGATEIAFMPPMSGG